MQYPARFSDLPPYSFTRLTTLLDGTDPGGPVTLMSLGEPQHPMPEGLVDTIVREAAGFSRYPVNPGAPELLSAVAAWAERRYGVPLDPDTRVMALNGTREGLFNTAIALCPETKAGGKPYILTPNPFYQVYAVAALTVAAEPYFVDATAETGFLPDFAALPPEVLDRTAVAYVCSPSNPQGAVADETYWRDLLALAEKHDFIVFADECYSEIYRDTPPPGILQVGHAIGADPERIVAFHSLSKRSSLPGLRSGFAAAGPKAIHQMRLLRSYAGAPLPMPLQMAAAALWSDETHVAQNRALYREKYRIADDVMGDVPGYIPPQAGFFLWLPVPDGEETTLRLWRDTGVKVLPGAYLSRDTAAGNPGKGYIRVAMVAPKEEMQAGLIRVRDCVFG